ncbi:TIGR02530 family flagellar biosynthesis protein [Fervidibacillus halotolerans]|uniref:Flagellar protein n=1 Tax=Fervidibacillus halotolerans TaxID=2980027 RepID=A0A9E8M385_9BACI|nr:TIGR02530 family flagellar biosynthesis protein [Fervidibacillus halotolerans]WAA13599.1 flagellar protein [Fervidibacillus halotolerans]
MHIQKSFIPPVGFQKSSKTAIEHRNVSSFTHHLKEAVEKYDRSLVISKHAKERIQQRDIKISEANWNKISEKVKEAKEMGVNESLVLLKDAALIVSAKNETVITAMNRQEATKQIFTNINGTIIIDES